MVTDQAVVLVGGRGTRLGSLVDATPKPLLPIAGTPLLKHIVDALGRHGFKDILLLAGYKSEAVDAFAKDSTNASVCVRSITESSPLGTGGALVGALPYLKSSFLVMNGDTFFDVNFNDLLLPDQSSTLAKIALSAVPDTARYGRVTLDRDRVAAMQEKNVPGPGLISGGIYCLRKEAISLLPTGVSSIENDLFPQLILQQAIEGKAFPGFFLDIGIPSDFERAQTELPAKLTRPAAFLDRDGVLNRDIGYASSAASIEWVPGAKTLVKRLNDAGFFVFVVTNQAGIARGYYTATDVEALHDWMQNALRKAGAHIDAFYYCPHHPEFTGPCTCRKPEPGMITNALSDWPVNQAKSFLIGDKPTDIEAAQRAGVSGFQFLGGDVDEFAGTLGRLLAEPDGADDPNRY
jgi:D,D-heptose 1,7-bisphosphate phosphatase